MSAPYCQALSTRKQVTSIDISNYSSIELKYRLQFYSILCLTSKTVYTDYTSNMGTVQATSIYIWDSSENSAYKDEA